MNGASMGNPGLAGGGGLLRDENGSWIGGFARKIGVASSFIAELWALRDGLLLCRQTNAQAVAIELDARAIVDAFNHQTNSNTVVSTIMDDCRHLVNQIPQVSIRHVYK
nr:putative ribonuclease h protein [Quercus suber]